MVTNADAADRVMDALGHQTRRDILHLLRGKPLPVGAIADQLPISRPAVSKHLRILNQAGLVEFAASGTRNIFRLRPSGFQTARLYLEDFWDQALANFQQVAETLDEPDP
jgi:DNA-binding transcriptional ArsR family regulator